MRPDTETGWVLSALGAIVFLLWIIYGLFFA